MDFLNAIQAELASLISLALVGCVGIATRYVVGYLKNKGIMTKINNHKEIANIAVNSVEQIYKASHGEEKLNLAKIEFIKLANAKGVKISEKEIDAFIESAVKEMNKVIKEETKK